MGRVALDATLPSKSSIGAFVGGYRAAKIVLGYAIQTTYGIEPSSSACRVDVLSSICRVRVEELSTSDAAAPA